MENASQFVRQTIKRTLMITAVWVVLWGIVPAWKSIFSALAIGSAVSVYFAVSVARQTEMATAIAMRGGKRKPVFPLIARLVVVVGAVMVAQKLAFPNVYVMIAAFFTYQMVIFVGMLGYRKKAQHSKPEGVK